MKNVENELKAIRVQLSDKEDQLISVQKSLDRERDEKMALLDEKTKDETEFMAEKRQWQSERQELKQQIAEMIEISKNEKNARRTEVDAEEISQAYMKVIKDKEGLENENGLLKQEIKRLQMIISHSHEADPLKSSMFTNDEDFGYSSSRNTLEKPHHKHTSSIASSQLSEGEFISLQNSNIQNNNPPASSTFERKLKSLFGFSHRGGNG